MPLFVSRQDFVPSRLWEFLARVFQVQNFESARVPEGLSQADLLDPQALLSKLGDSSVFLKILKIVFSCKTWEQLVQKLGLREPTPNNRDSSNHKRVSRKEQDLLHLSRILAKHDFDCTDASEAPAKELQPERIKEGEFFIRNRAKIETDRPEIWLL